MVTDSPIGLYGNRWRQRSLRNRTLWSLDLRRLYACGGGGGGDGGRAGGDGGGGVDDGPANVRTVINPPINETNPRPSPPTPSTSN